MANDRLREEYKALYNAEIARRGDLTQAIDRPIAIITALLGVAYFALSDLAAPVTVPQAIRVAAVLVLVTMLGRAILSLVRSTYEHVYGYVATPRVLEEYRAALDAHYRAHEPAAARDIEVRVLDHIYDLYIEGAHQNALINDVRSGHLHNAKRRVIWAVPVAFLVLVLKGVSTPTFYEWATRAYNLLSGAIQ